MKEGRFTGAGSCEQRSPVHASSPQEKTGVQRYSWSAGVFLKLRTFLDTRITERSSELMYVDFASKRLKRVHGVKAI